MKQNSTAPSDERLFTLAEIIAQERTAIGIQPPAPTLQPLDKNETVEQANARQFPELIKTIHQSSDAEAAAALCLSGGGIRSASFALGVVQALAAGGLLQRFHYLSTVSGGGYLGGMLSAWRKHEAEAQAQLPPDQQKNPDDLVIKKLQNSPDTSLTSDPYGREAAEIRHLREYSNYLAPKLGLFSADTLTLIVTCVRNLLLNWTVLLALLALGLMLPWIGMLIAVHSPTPLGQQICILLAGLCFTACVTYSGLDVPCLYDRQLSQRTYIFGFLAPLATGVLLLCYWWAGECNAQDQRVYDIAQQWMTEHGRIAITKLLAAACLIGGVITWIIQKARPPKQPSKRTLSALHRAFFYISTALIFGVLTPCAIRWLALNAFYKPSVDAAFFATFAPPFIMVVFFLAQTFFVALVSRISNEHDREWYARSSAWVFTFSIAWILSHIVTLYIPCALDALTVGDIGRVGLEIIGGVSGLLAAIFASSSSTDPKPGNQKQSRATLIMGLFALIFLAAIASLTTRFLNTRMAPAFQQVRTKWEQHSVNPQTEWQTWEKNWAEKNPALVEKLRAFDAEKNNERQAIAKEEQAQQQKIKPRRRVTTLAQEEPNLWQKFKTNFHENLRYSDFGLLWQRPELADLYRTQLYTVGGGLFAVAAIMGWLMKSNRFTLHATYRSRLVRCFLGAARTAARKPHPFTGFDPDDDTKMMDLPTRGPLFHVVNMALNLTASEKLAWQERMADSFTATPLHCGNRRIGYRTSSEFARGISLGTVVAISGAAANPNAGYHSSPLLTFLMTLFNLRLGWWVGNPAREASGFLNRDAWKSSGPVHTADPLIREALAQTGEKSAYIHLSDGGHFENMGLYEMVLRRCRWIVLVDGEQDGQYAFDGLGNAVRKIRIDFGIRIEFDALDLITNKDGINDRRGWSIGKIHYADADGDQAPHGYILYIKPLLGAELTADLTHYAASHPDFPHETTGDQFFSESQFESYRTLGHHTMSRYLRNRPDAEHNIRKLFE